MNVKYALQLYCFFSSFVFVDGASTGIYNNTITMQISISTNNAVENN
jgi:hypothetical protein